MINFASIVPHPPLIIPAIGKENIETIKNTQKALEGLRDKIAEKEIETIIIISPHGLVREDGFTINASPKFLINFKNFGDFNTKSEMSLDVGLAYDLKEKLEDKKNIQFITEENLDHGAGVPLYYLTDLIKSIKIIPIAYSYSSLEDNFEFGKLLGEALAENPKKVAIVASGDLSHRLSKDSPAGYSARGKKFDKKLIDLLKEKKTEEILEMDPELISEAGECGLRSIAILLGALNKTEYNPKLLSYEGPFGVGYLVMEMEIK